VTTESNKDVPDKLGLGTEGLYQYPLNGFISEVISYTTDLNTTDRQSMENSQANYYVDQLVNANLNSLSLSNVTLSPTFTTNTTAYTASVNNATTSINVTAIPDFVGATLSININSGVFTTLNSGSPSTQLL
jgi:hypothetical protein